MTVSKLQVYDPPMCCSSGVCGPNVNPELVRFSSDLDWLRKQGVEVERFNLSSHPGAFARAEAVREALKNEGGDCLPVIVVNGSIISKGIYPQRSDLMKATGIESEEAGLEGTAAAPQENEAAVCGPGCSCGSPSGGKRMKTVASLIVLLAVASIFVYKASTAKDAASNNIAAEGRSAFALAQAAPTTIVENATAPESPQAGQKFGDYLESLSALNTVAINQDAVFVFIPAPANELADDKTNAAVLAVQQTLKTNKITLGLYTLQTSSSDYPTISKQVQPPAILIASKGKGMAAVSGEMTEQKLLQAFVSSASAGGCGPSGCGPSSAGCN